MTDNRSAIAGRYPQEFPLRITCLLSEGAITVADRAYGRDNAYDKSYTFAAELRENDVVALANDAENTYEATGGLPVVERAVNAETLVIGKIVSAPHWLRAVPATSGVADTWAKQLAAGYYRVALVELWAGITKVEKATVMCNGSNACVPGVGTTLKFNITGAYEDHVLSFDSEASGGVGVIPFHYVGAGSDGDEYTILCGITGPLIAATGA